MSDDKVRRVFASKDGFYAETPNGDHFLSPVDEYVPVKRKVWERVVAALRHFGRDYCFCSIDPATGDVTDQCLGCRALAEIEEVK